MKEFIDTLSSLCEQYGISIYPVATSEGLFLVVRDQYGTSDFEVIDKDTKYLLM